MLQRFAKSLPAVCCGLLIALPFAAAQGFKTIHSTATLTLDQERFFVVLLSQQSADNRIKWSHTFATFIRTDGASPRPHIVETRTISWLPASEIVSVARPAEPGVNKSLEATLAWAEAHGLQITVNGPFEIQRDLYDRAVAQATRLERGEIKYKANDRCMRGTAKNCSHAVADIVEDHGRLDSGVARGQDATLMVVHHFEPFFVSGGTSPDADYLLQALNLNRYVRPQATLVARYETGRPVGGAAIADSVR